MSDAAKKLQDTASLCYTDEDVVDGFKLTQVARSLDELAETLEVTAIDCQVSMMDPTTILEAGYGSEDSAVWEDVYSTISYILSLLELLAPLSSPV